jgi:hypothetical protein
MIFSSFFVIICEVETRKQEIKGKIFKKYLDLHEIELGWPFSPNLPYPQPASDNIVRMKIPEPKKTKLKKSSLIYDDSYYLVQKIRKFSLILPSTTVKKNSNSRGFG